MEVLKDVTLRVYELQAAPEGTRGANVFNRLLPSLGAGAYHTSLQIDGYRYTFAANVGIIKTSAKNEGIPTGATYKQAILLGASSLKNRSQLHGIIQRLGELYFTPRSYHLVHRNCNHFSETLAMAVIWYDQLADLKDGANQRLDTYPAWINRLANTSKAFVGHDVDIVPCQPLLEARKAVNTDDKVGWNLGKAEDAKAAAPPVRQTVGGKKMLSDKQKAALAKIRNK